MFNELSKPAREKARKSQIWALDVNQKLEIYNNTSTKVWNVLTDTYTRDINSRTKFSCYSYFNTAYFTEQKRSEIQLGS